jgi:hypothetical protein
MPIVIGKGNPHVNIHKQDTLPAKAAVGYLYAPGTALRCNECAFITLGGKCTDYAGTEQDVSAENGSCNDWQDLRKGRIRGNGSRTRLQTAYLENLAGFGCRRCEHMNLAKSDCSAVDKDSPGDTPGRIDPYGCCTLWEKDPKRGTWSESKFQ